jgi:hypothetical protein
LASTSSPAIGSSIATRLRASDNCLNHTRVSARHRNASGEPYRGMIDDVPTLRGVACQRPRALCETSCVIGTTTLEVIAPTGFNGDLRSACQASASNTTPAAWHDERYALAAAADLNANLVASQNGGATCSPVQQFEKIDRGADDAEQGIFEYRADLASRRSKHDRPSDRG